MPSNMCCVVPGCKPKKKEEGVMSFHRFPTKSDRRELCKQWLMAIKNPRYDETTDADVLIPLRVCSQHFTPDDFNRNMMAELMDKGKRKKPRIWLKDDAVPSVFPHPSTSLPLFKRSTAEDLQGSMERGGSNPNLTTPSTSTADLPLAKRSRKENHPPTESSNEEALFREFVSGTPSTSTPGTASRHGLLMLGQSALMDTSSSSAEVLDPKDPAYVPEDDLSATATPTPTPLSSQEELGWQEPKVIVYESKIRELFKMCQQCGKPINDTLVTYAGAQTKVRWDCLGGHSGTWTSSPEIRGMPEVNLLSAASVLFTGSTITELVDWATLMNVHMIQPTTFYDMQKSYLGPAIEAEYTEQRDEILARLCVEEEEQKDGTGPSIPIHLAGDGRCDSPGFSAKYCHYTLMLDNTGEILQTDLVQVTEASSSVAMEALGFERALNTLLDVGLQVEVVATDRSPSVRKMMRDQYPEINHQFDLWHTAKGFNKKLMAKSKKKGRGQLADWSRSLNNHLWYSSASCRGNTQELKRRWLSMLHHVQGVHSWTEGGQKYGCLHPPLSQDGQRKKKWLSTDSPVYEDLERLVCDKRLLKDIDQLGLFKHTGALEVFHSALLKYMPKRLHFSYAGMTERGMLAVLEHNENIVKRRQANLATGGPRTKQSFCKRSKAWVVQKVYEPHTHLFRQSLVNRAISLRQDPTVKFQVLTSSLVRKAVPPNIAKTPKPPKEEAILAHRSRFDK